VAPSGRIKVRRIARLYREEGGQSEVRGICCGAGGGRERRVRRGKLAGKRDMHGALLERGGGRVRHRREAGSGEVAATGRGRGMQVDL
jgi:hypothetical protein